MRVHIYETGRHHEAARVDLAPGGVRGIDPADIHDPVAAHGHIAQEPGVAGAVDNFAAADYQIVGWLGRIRSRGQQSERGERPGYCSKSASVHGAFGGSAAAASAATAQQVAGIEMNWFLPCGSPLSKKTWTGRDRVSTNHEPSSRWALSKNATPRS